jgi:hypothetical protein
MKKALIFTLLMAFSLIFLGCNDSPNTSSVNIVVINETGRTITDVRFTASDGSIHMLEEIAQSRSNHGQGQHGPGHGLGHRGQGHCWISRDDTYTLSWFCVARDMWIYAQTGGRCGGREQAHRFSFRANRQRTIVLNEDDTCELVD